MTDADRLLTAFIKYVDEWQALDRQYMSLPSWRWIAQNRILKQQHRLTRVFTAVMKKRGIL